MNDIQKEALQTRTSEYSILPDILGRWSPRAMTGEPLDEKTIMTLFEAARWAPSSYNNQPWRFIYAMRDTEAWDTLFSLMGEFNQSWTKQAAMIAVVVSKDTFDHNGNPAPTHSYDTGAAWMALAIQGTHMGLVVHGMQGFDYDAAKTALNIPDGYTVEAMLAVGKPAPKNTLPEDLQERETPSDRRPIEEIAMEGSFQAA